MKMGRGKETSGSNKSVLIVLLGARLSNGVKKHSPRCEVREWIPFCWCTETGALILFQPTWDREIDGCYGNYYSGQAWCRSLTHLRFLYHFTWRSKKMFFFLHFSWRELFFVLTNYAFNFHSLREYFQALNICCHVFKLHYASFLIFLESFAPVASVFSRCPVHFNFISKFFFSQIRHSTF